jgi:hypothetical protein
METVPYTTESICWNLAHEQLTAYPKYKQNEYPYFVQIPMRNTNHCSHYIYRNINVQLFKLCTILSTCSFETQHIDAL